MSALNWIATARDDEFASRVLFLATKTAQAVASEDPATIDHAVRLDYAKRVIRGTDNPKMIATHVISSNPTIQQTINAAPEQLGKNVPDSDIEFALSSIWTSRSLAFEGVAG
jgi:hypothetical protein